MMTGLRTRQVVLQKTMKQRCAHMADLMQHVHIVKLCR